MGKENKTPVKEEPKAKEKANKPKSTQQTEAPESLLAKLRPRRRLIFFLGWMLACVWVLVMYDACDVPTKNRKDCGWSGISAGECRSWACFIKGGTGALAKKSVKLKRSEGATLGLAVRSSGDSWLVTGIEAGSAIEEYNAQLPPDSEDQIQLGDRIAKMDGAKGDGISKVLKATGAKTMQVELLRPKLPSYFMWIANQNGKPNFAEKVLTSPGFKQWSTSFSYFGGVGMACWLLSGYPAGSLPLYYLGVSGAVAFGTIRCCHDDNVSGGTAHCYKPKLSKFEDVVAKIKDDTIALFAKIRKDPKAWFKKLLS